MVAFFDAMGSVMGKSNVRVETLIRDANDDYVAECQHVWTARGDGQDLDHIWCVLWTIANGQIIAGRHLAGD